MCVLSRRSEICAPAGDGVGAAPDPMGVAGVGDVVVVVIEAVAGADAAAGIGAPSVHAAAALEGDGVVVDSVVLRRHLVGAADGLHDDAIGAAGDYDRVTVDVGVST